MECGTFWGSHGCDKEAGHVEAGDLLHVCGLRDPEGPCSQHDGTFVRAWVTNDGVTWNLSDDEYELPTYRLRD